MLKERKCGPVNVKCSKKTSFFGFCVGCRNPAPKRPGLSERATPETSESWILPYHRQEKRKKRRKKKKKEEEQVGTTINNKIKTNVYQTSVVKCVKPKCRRS
jgi:hypothetical protein